MTIGTPTGTGPEEMLPVGMVAIPVAAKVPAIVAPAGRAMLAIGVGSIIATNSKVSLESLDAMCLEVVQVSRKGG